MAVEITFHVNSSKGLLPIKITVEDYASAEEAKEDALKKGLRKDLSEDGKNIEAYFPPLSIIQIDFVSLEN